MNRKYVFILLILIALVVPRIIVSMNQIIDPFAYSTAALSEHYLQTGRITINPFNPTSMWTSHADTLSVRIIPPTLLAVLSSVTSISLDTLPFIPIVGVLFIFLSYVFGLVFSNSKTVAFLYAMVMALEVQVIRATNVAFYITLGYSFLMVFLIIYLKLLKTQGKTEVFLLIFSFIALYLTYYSAEFFAVAFSLSLFLITTLPLLSRKKNNLKIQKIRPKLPLILIPMIFLLFFFGFDVVVPLFLNANLRGIESVASFSTGDNVSMILNLLYEALLIVPLAFFVILLFFGRSKINLTCNEKDSKIYLAIIVASVAFSFSYIAFGLSLFSRAFYIFFPLLAIYSLFHFQTKFNTHFFNRFFKSTKILLSILLIIVPLICLGVFLLDPLQPYTPNGNSRMAPSVSFLVQSLGTGKCSVLSSLDISGQLFYKTIQLNKGNIEASQFGNDVNVLYSKDSNFTDTVFIDKGYDYLLLSRSFESRAVFADGWYWAQVAPNASSLVSANTAFNRVYDDNQAITFAYVK